MGIKKYGHRVEIECNYCGYSEQGINTSIETATKHFRKSGFIVSNTDTCFCSTECQKGRAEARRLTNEIPSLNNSDALVEPKARIETPKPKGYNTRA